MAQSAKFGFGQKKKKINFKSRSLWSSAVSKRARKLSAQMSAVCWDGGVGRKSTFLQPSLHHPAEKAGRLVYCCCRRCPVLVQRAAPAPRESIHIPAPGLEPRHPLHPEIHAPTCMGSTQTLPTTARRSVLLCYSSREWRGMHRQPLAGAFGSQNPALDGGVGG